MVLGVVAAVAIGVVVVVVVAFVLREDPGGKPLGEAVEEFEAANGGPSPDAGGTGPLPGVYQAEGEGRESISFPAVSQSDGAVLPVTVESVDEHCWRVKVDFNAAHWQDWNYCDVDGRVVDRGGQTYQRWDFGTFTVENLSDFRCDPPGVMIDPSATEGTSWPQSCTGTNSQSSGRTISSGPYTFVGTEELTIGGAPTAALRYRQERSIADAQQGSTVVEFWFEVDTGLPLRMERTVRVDSDSPVGTVTYDESGWWQLSSTKPVG